MSSRRWLILIVVLLVSLSLHAQPLENIQILKGLSRPEIQRVMNEMRAGLGVHCHYCHAADETHGASDTKPQKAKAREMIRMVIDLNARHFGGKPVVTCFTCHNGKPVPTVIPPLPQAVPPDEGAPPPVDPKTLPALSSVIQKYVTAVGRELAPGTPRRFKGTQKSTRGPVVPVTMADAAGKMRRELQLPDGSMVTQELDANGGWVRDKNGVRDVTGDDLIAARIALRPYAPFHTSSIGEDAHVVASEKIGERNTWVVATPTARYWFDTDSGLLLRRVVYFDSPVGRIPEQTDFDDYRTVGTSKLPFTTRVSIVDPWLSGTRQAESIEVGVEIPAKEFEKPGTGEG